MLAVYFKADGMYLKKIAELKMEEASADDITGLGPQLEGRLPGSPSAFPLCRNPQLKPSYEGCDFCWIWLARLGVRNPHGFHTLKLGSSASSRELAHIASSRGGARRLS